jgi:hypothetical protein
LRVFHVAESRKKVKAKGGRMVLCKAHLSVAETPHKPPLIAY